MQTWNPDYGKKTKFIHRSRARRTDAEPIIHKVNLLVVIGPFLFQYTTRACPAQWGKKKTVAGQVDFVRLLYLLWRRFWEIRAAVSLRLHKPITTCRDTVADWRLFCRVSFAFSKLTRSTSVKKSIAPPPGKYNIASALSFHVIQYNNGCSWRASFPSRKSGVFCCHFFGDDPVVCRCRSPPPFDSPVNHPRIEMEVHNEEN